jgi:catechol 2,3-dioxygenase-like lactoylglutathione lyase family enzyme
VSTDNRKYVVGGVVLDRPFKIRRLGHVGLYLPDLLAGLAFYVDLLGFRLTDVIPGDEGAAPKGYFASHGTDHHALVLVDSAVGVQRDDRYLRGITVNQITFQVGSLEEVIGAADYFRKYDTATDRFGRDSPGSNWAIYIKDPEDHILELYYGIEQIGWDRRSKPRSMNNRTRAFPKLPVESELSEIEEAERHTVELHSGFRPQEVLPRTYNVGGVLLARPFKATKLGPVVLFVRDVESAERFYVEVLGLVRSEAVTFDGHTCVYLRHGTDHHSIGLVPLALREKLQLPCNTTLMSLGVEVGSYSQLRDAVAFLKNKGVRFIDIPAALHPGIDYAAYAIDPAGHCVQLYYYMEQVGWDGRVRPAGERRAIQNSWPETLDSLSDTFVDQTLPGPWL